MRVQVCQDPWAAEARPVSSAMDPITFLKADWFSEVMCTGIEQQVRCSTKHSLLAHSFIDSFIHKCYNDLPRHC